jgi:hypothetical protein
VPISSPRVPIQVPGVPIQSPCTHSTGCLFKPQGRLFRVPGCPFGPQVPILTGCPFGVPGVLISGPRVPTSDPRVPHSGSWVSISDPWVPHSPRNVPALATGASSKLGTNALWSWIWARQDWRPLTLMLKLSSPIDHLVLNNQRRAFSSQNGTRSEPE